MDKSLYAMIFKRKSFHLFRNIGNDKISQSELNDIYQTYKNLSPLYKDIKTKIKIVPADATTCKRGQEYCILLYSEEKGNYLQNIGYIGEQLDLHLVSKNIGTLWYGIGKTADSINDDLNFVIMIAIAKIDDESKFRKDMFKSKRKPKDEIWCGEEIAGVTDIVRFAPSACNTQPWIVKHIDNTLQVYRYKKEGKRGIMPINKVSFYNQIDIGIFLCILEICLDNNRILFSVERYEDLGANIEMQLISTYKLQQNNI